MWIITKQISSCCSSHSSYNYQRFTVYENWSQTDTELFSGFFLPQESYPIDLVLCVQLTLVPKIINKIINNIINKIINKTINKIINKTITL